MRIKNVLALSVVLCFNFGSAYAQPAVEVHEVPLGTILPCFADSAHPLSSGFVWADGKTNWPNESWVPSKLKGRPVPDLNGTGSFLRGGDPETAYSENDPVPQDGKDVDTPAISVAEAKKAGLNTLRIKNNPALYSASGYFYCVQGPTAPRPNPYKPENHPSNKPPNKIDLARASLKSQSSTTFATNVNGIVSAGRLPNSVAGGMYGFADEGSYPGVHVSAEKMTPKNFPVRWIIRVK